MVNEEPSGAMKVVIRTPASIRHHFASGVHSCEFLAWRLGDHGITGHFVCCVEHSKNVLLLTALSWDDLHESWKLASQNDFVRVVDLLCKLVDARIKKASWYRLLDSTEGDLCGGEKAFWGASELEIESGLSYAQIYEFVRGLS